MPKPLELIADHLPRVATEDLQRLTTVVETRDAGAFVAGLQAFVHERVETVELPAALRADTRWQIYKDIDALRLLGSDVGPRGRKLPDRQLDPHKQQLTQSVLQTLVEIDNRTLYRALSEPLEGLGGRSPVEATGAFPLDHIVDAARHVPGVH
ncbi:integrase [Burkholderia plantarii]|uniref:integrase n=1 Tax=Burkholderia plantarii TaxID=41899 RepID=UPI0018DD340E|nr:integrase [Burkholderia plantarii]MBI0327886.1 integrase [Burkholderia plantarii]